MSEAIGPIMSIAGSIFGGPFGGLLGGMAAPVVTKMLSGDKSQTPQAPQAPTPAAVTAMPDAQSQQDAQRRSIAAQVARRGRASTILTNNQPTETLGG